MLVIVAVDSETNPPLLRSIGQLARELELFFQLKVDFSLRYTYSDTASGANKYPSDRKLSDKARRERADKKSAVLRSSLERNLRSTR
jgi:hypothetical protein